MEHKKDLEELNKKSLEKVEDYLKSKTNLNEEHKKKLAEAKTKWQDSWSSFMDVLMYLEHLEL